MKLEDDSCCFQKQSNFKWYSSDITIKPFSNQSKSFLAIQKCIFFNTMALILFFLISLLISIIQPRLVAKIFFHVHRMKSNLFVSITFIFLLSLRQEKYKITLFDFYFLVDMQSKFSCVKTMRRTSDSSSITYTWRLLFVLIWVKHWMYDYRKLH